MWPSRARGLPRSCPSSSPSPTCCARRDVKGENTPFKIYTYLASGKPIVATRIPTHTQLLDDSLAFLVEPSADAVAAGLRQALDHKDEARARAERGLALVEREYSSERYREKVARAYSWIERAVSGGRDGA